MKKRWIWVGAILAVAVIVGVRAVRSDVPPTVNTQVLASSRVEQTVSCNGVVEAADGVGVMAPVSCVIREVRVSEGQRVKKGDVVAVVDREATADQAGDPITKLALAAMDEDLIAPEDGIVVKVDAAMGETLPFGTPCVTLVRSCDLRVRIAIREKDLKVLREGMRVRISGDGFEQKAYSAMLTEISATASVDSSSTIVEGLVTLDDEQADASFRLGLTAKATVITSVVEEGILVPYEAVLADEQGSFVYIAEQGVAKKHRTEDAVQLAQGLLLNDSALLGCSVILEPEKIAGDGMAILEAGS